MSPAAYRRPRSVAAVGTRSGFHLATTETDLGREDVGLVAVTAAGRAAAADLAVAWPGETRTYHGPAAEALPRAATECGAVVAFLATGAAVRLLAPYLGDKGNDPGVVCVDEARRFAVALLGGHEGGANALAHRVAAVLGAAPVVTTASDAAGVPALDQLPGTMGWQVEPGSDVTGVSAALLSGEPVSLVTDCTWPLPALPDNVGQGSGLTPGRAAIVVSDRSPGAVGDDNAVVVYRPATLAVGVGASRGAPAEEISRLAGQALDEAGLSRLSLRHLATVDAKAGEPGIVAAAAELGVPLVTSPPEALAAIDVPNPSDAVRAEVGTPSVAEAASLRAEAAEGAELVLAKRKSANATVAIARHHPRGRLALIGLGPGNRDLLTPRATAELRRASIVVGLDQYVDRVRDLLRPGTRVLSSGLGDEEARAGSAVDQATTGHAVALVGSGDAGVYAMASPALEQVPAHVEVVGVPGITAALAAASLLGAPLGHDHVIISLSDLHTPWDVIERRVRAAAEADLAVAFYNPRSHARGWQLAAALRILARHRPPDTPVGFVRAAFRAEQSVSLTTLAAANSSHADMLTLIVVGNSATRVAAGRMVTPRGYRWKVP